MQGSSFTKVFDIGANLGDYTSLMLAKGAGKVITVEASPHLGALLNQKFAGNDKVTVVAKAVSFDNQQVDLFLSDSHTISTVNPEWITNSRFTGEHKWAHPVKTDAVTIDELVAQYGVPDHIKIDVEGYELQALMGMKNMVPALISFEWAEESKESISRCLYYLKQLGYNHFGYSLNNDKFDHFDGKFTSFGSFTKPFLDSLDPARKTEWGMIYVKP